MNICEKALNYFIYNYFTRHVSDKDRQSKLYRNVQPVFSIDDEDEDGGIDLLCDVTGLNLSV